MTTNPQGPERKRGSGDHKDKKKDYDEHEEWMKWNNIGGSPPYEPEFKSLITFTSIINTINKT